MSQPKEPRTLGLRRGARAIAAFVFDDPEEFKTIYRLQKALGLFKLDGMLCGREETMTARVAKLEDSSHEPAA